MGKTSDLRKELYAALFGTGGLVDCNDVVSFDAQTEKIHAGVLKEAPAEFQVYFERKLVGVMRDNVVVGPGFNRWTNNNCESANHVLKQAIQWNPKQIPELIDILQRLVVGQNAEADRALCGLGEFALCSSHAKYRMTTDAWTAMSVNQQRKAVKACFRLPSAADKVTSDDGTLMMPTTPGGGKKPGQRKRPRNERTKQRSKKLKTSTD